MGEAAISSNRGHFISFDYWALATQTKANHSSHSLLPRPPGSACAISIRDWRLLHVILTGT